MRVRRALPSEFNDVYMMGFDAWSGGKPENEYLDACKSSSKYKTGTWYVLENEEGMLCASLITYALSPQVQGIGSISTPAKLRRQGFASSLTSIVVSILEAEGTALIFLWSDIDPTFYIKLGFEALPLSQQPDPKSVCMVRRGILNSTAQAIQIHIPKYF